MQRKDILIDLCRELNIDYSFYSNDWVILLNHKNHTEYLVGNNFNLNSSSCANLCTDKVACYEILNANSIPAIPHQLISSLSEINPAYPFVLKPYNGSRGNQVFLCHNETEAKTAAAELQKTDHYYCYSPYFDAIYEYRCFFLADKVIYVYRKNRHKSWQFNLSKGATPTLVDPSDPKIQKIISLAERAGKAINANFVTIDIMESSSHEYKVLEINCNVTTKIFAEHIPNGAEISKEIYRKVLKNLFNIA